MGGGEDTCFLMPSLFQGARSAGSESPLRWAASWGDSLLWPCFVLHCIACSRSESKRRYVVHHPWLSKEHPDTKGRSCSFRSASWTHCWTCSFWSSSGIPLDLASSLAYSR